MSVNLPQRLGRYKATVIECGHGVKGSGNAYFIEMLLDVFEAYDPKQEQWVDVTSRGYSGYLSCCIQKRDGTPNTFGINQVVKAFSDVSWGGDPDLFQQNVIGKTVEVSFDEEVRDGKVYRRFDFPKVGLEPASGKKLAVLKDKLAGLVPPATPSQSKPAPAPPPRAEEPQQDDDIPF